MNDLWMLPGAARFLRRVERYLRDGVSAVVRFPGEAPGGFRDRLLSALDGAWRCDIFRPDAAELPFEGLRQRFAPRMSNDWKPTLLDLCEHEEFHGRLVWLDGLDALDREDWFNWKRFLSDYAQASRSVQDFERTLFVAVLEGSPPEEAPPNDVTLVTCDWRDVIDEMDLLFLAHEHLRQRDMRPAMRSLLATTVARVAVWDVEVAVRLLDEGEGVILAPCSMLRSVADEKGWKIDTPVGWEYGTASATGTPHAALASLGDPPRELQQRLWSAQVSVLLPEIDGWRRAFVLEHRRLLADHLHGDGDGRDPLDLDVGDLVGMAQRPGFGSDMRRLVRKMNQWRNDIAHLQPLPPGAARTLAAG